MKTSPHLLEKLNVFCLSPLYLFSVNICHARSRLHFTEKIPSTEFGQGRFDKCQIFFFEGFPNFFLLDFPAVTLDLLEPKNGLCDEDWLDFVDSSCLFFGAEGQENQMNMLVVEMLEVVVGGLCIGSWISNYKCLNLNHLCFCRGYGHLRYDLGTAFYFISLR